MKNGPSGNQREKETDTKGKQARVPHHNATVCLGKASTKAIEVSWSVAIETHATTLCGEQRRFRNNHDRFAWFQFVVEVMLDACNARLSSYYCY